MVVFQTLMYCGSYFIIYFRRSFHGFMRYVSSDSMNRLSYQREIPKWYEISCILALLSNFILE